MVEVLGETGYQDDATPEDGFSPDKPLAETAMLLHAAAACSDSSIRAQVDQLAGRVAALAQSHRTACAIALYPTIAFQLAMPHILLTRLGRTDARLDGILALSKQGHAQAGREVLPHRALEQLWLRDIAGETARDTDFVAAARASVLAHPVDLLWGARDDAYAHTHALMYLTDFGYAARPLPRPRDVVLAESGALLARGLLLEDYDLCAELVMAWPLTGAPWSPAAAFGFRVLAEFEDEIGYLSSGNGIPERYERLAGEERRRYALAATYHTAFVMGIACALALRPGRAPPARFAGVAAPEALAEALRRTIPDADTPWQRSYACLPAGERAALAPFLVDMALVAAARRHDHACTAHVLGLAARHGLTGAPACGQAAELLGRLQACAGAPG